MSYYTERITVISLRLGAAPPTMLTSVALRGRASRRAQRALIEYLQSELNAGRVNVFQSNDRLYINTDRVQGEPVRAAVARMGITVK